LGSGRLAADVKGKPKAPDGAMRFNLVDRIVSVENNQLLRATKNLSLGEEYLADHFPTFPVMPGVLMLQALVEAGSWLLRIRDDFRHSVIVLREAKQVKYGHFMEPGQRLDLTVELAEETGDAATFKGKGETSGTTTVNARFTLARFNLRDRNPAWQSVDERLVQQLRERYLLLRPETQPTGRTVGGTTHRDPKEVALKA
jgi:3-hydroxyacyl-[acyl-carrier-protein] dehydratase